MSFSKSVQNYSLNAVDGNGGGDDEGDKKHK